MTNEFDSEVKAVDRLLEARTGMSAQPPKQAAAAYLRMELNRWLRVSCDIPHHG